MRGPDTDPLNQNPGVDQAFFNPPSPSDPSGVKAQTLHLDLFFKRAASFLSMTRQILFIFLLFYIF